MRTLKKVGWSCEGRRGLDKEALGHNSVPKINPIFSCWRAADVTLSPFDKRRKTGRAHFLSATFRTRTWQRYRLPHHLPRRFVGVWRQCRAGCPYPVHKFRCSEVGRLIGECVIENCPIGGWGWSRSGSYRCTGMFVAHLITHAHFHQEDDQRQPGNCRGDQHHYSFTTAWGAIQVTKFIQSGSLCSRTVSRRCRIRAASSFR